MEENKSSASESQSWKVYIVILIASAFVTVVGLILVGYFANVAYLISCSFVSNPTGAVCILPSGVSLSDLGTYQMYALLSGLMVVAGAMGIGGGLSKNLRTTMILGIFVLLFVILFDMAAGLVPVS